MAPQWFALLTAAAWGIGGYFEKKGLVLGGMAPQMGITIRTGIALIILAAVSVPQWRSLTTAGPKALLYVGIGGGLVAGVVGMLCYYTAIKHGSLSQVMPIAFTSPLFSVMLGMLLGGEPVSLRAVLGMTLTIGGIAVLSLG
jgi:transporter family protein